MHEDVPTRPANHTPGDPGDPTQSLWLVSYADDDDREMTPPQIYQALRRGEIDMETIVWRDGMPDWLPISDVSALKQAIERAGKTAVDKKKTVMGGFTAQPAPPFPNAPAAGVPNQPTPGVPTPGPRPVAHSPVPRSTLIGTGARNAPLARGLSSAVPSPKVGNLDDGDLDENLLESVRPPPMTTQQLFPKLPSNTKTAPMPEVRLRDEAAISLNSDVIESLPSSALESVVAELPPTRPPSAPHGIFDVGDDTSRDVMPETDAPTAPLRAPVGAPHAPRPRPPLRDRSVAPAVTQLDSLAPDDPSLAPPPRRSSAGKVIGLLFLIGATAVAMFYLGRQTAESPTGTPVAASAPTGATAAAPLASAPTATAPAPEPEPATTTEAAASAAEPNDAQPDEADEPSRAAAKPVQRTAPSPRPAPPSPSPAPAPKPAEPKPAEPEPVAAAGPFDTAAASAALSAAAGQASSCRKPDDPSGVANVTVTFANSGRAINAVVSGPPFAGTTTGGCIASKMRAARVPPFAGDRITVKKVVVIQ